MNLRYRVYIYFSNNFVVLRQFLQKMEKYNTVSTLLLLLYRYREYPDIVRLSVRLMQFFVISFNDGYHDLLSLFPPSSLRRILAVLSYYNTESNLLLSPASEIYSFVSLLSQHSIISLQI